MASSEEKALGRNIGGGGTKDGAGLRVKFAARSDAIEERLKTDTRGLVTLDDFKAKRKHIERSAAEEQARREAFKRSRDVQEKRRRLRRANTATLSFDAGGTSSESDDGCEDRETRNAEETHDQLMSRNGHAKEPESNAVRDESYVVRGLGKDPSVPTSFLPDVEREAAERLARERLRLEWMQEQERIKKENVQVTYSFWDGAGHRRTLACTKGTTIGRFLAMVQHNFPQLRAASSETLMFVKEDLIIPHHYTFYDFIVSNARGKSGPLFDFSVQDDVRWLADASKEKQDVHAAKVVERRWYERNKHIFPASRWTVYDPLVDYGKYSIQ
ncbi:Protein FAM50-like [Porphyridium purpureum]|uniref:Protein FAM50-like n=1 Tax=Porphyridium purpureum TaxID=35688 RepID=A0A5J4YSZ8_PORPP|nr:Protein FAM50-like [Porphyridium purpureum]|eukprot:POR9103..scf227_4